MNNIIISPYHDHILEVLRHYLNDPTSSFSIGSFGAIAEFHRNLDEPLAINDICDNLKIATARGGLQVSLTRSVRPIAYETLSKFKHCWQQGIAFCLPQSEALSHKRTSLEELGPDEDAIRESDKEAVLFDMGLGALNCDFCIRTQDLELIKILRKHVGISTLDPHNQVMGAIIEASPHRIAISKLGRLEVFQAIGREQTPSGPHTHVLPKLLKGARTHSANMPVTPGYLPCLNLYPTSPLFDSNGDEKSFDLAAKDAFETLLSHWGNPEYGFEKARVFNAFKHDMPIEVYKSPESRLGRTAMRIALRQAARNENTCHRATAWLQRFDR